MKRGLIYTVAGLFILGGIALAVQGIIQNHGGWLIGTFVFWAAGAGAYAADRAMTVWEKQEMNKLGTGRR